MMQYTKPVYITRKDTFLATDEIVPYGGRIEVVSESMQKAAALDLLNPFKINSETTSILLPYGTISSVARKVSFLVI